MRFAITGATGFVGRHLVDRLTTDGHDVSALVRNPDDAASLESRGIRAVIGGLNDIARVAEAVRGADTVVNLARAKAHGVRPESEVIAVNVDGAGNVARASREAGAELIHASSTAIYGSRTGPSPVEETRSSAPDSAYARSKLDGERETHRHHPDATLLRMSAILGPRCDSWLPLFRSASKGTLRLVGDGRNLHHPIDVDDVVSMILQCAASQRSRGVIMNVAGPDPVAVRDLAVLMSKSVGGKSELASPVPTILAEGYIAAARALDSILGVKMPRIESVLFLTGHRTFSTAQAKATVGFSPRIPVAMAVQRTGEDYVSRGLI